MTPIHQQRINWFGGTRPSKSPIQKTADVDWRLMTPVHQQRMNWFDGTRPSKSPIQKICPPKETHANIKLGDRSRSGLKTDLPTQRNPRKYQIGWQEQKSIGDWFAHQKKPTPKSNLVTGAEVYWSLICPPKTDTQINFGERSSSRLEIDLPAQKRHRIDFGDRSRNGLETDLPSQNQPWTNQLVLWDQIIKQSRPKPTLWWPEAEVDWRLICPPKTDAKSTLVTGAEADWRLIYLPKTDTKTNFGDSSRCLFETDLSTQNRCLSSRFYRGPGPMTIIFFRERNSRQNKTVLPAQICYLSPFRWWSNGRIKTVSLSKNRFSSEFQLHRRIYRVKHKNGLVRTTMHVNSRCVRTKPFLCLTL
jgi:hypothetical protein